MRAFLTLAVLATSLYLASAAGVRLNSRKVAKRGDGNTCPSRADKNAWSDIREVCSLPDSSEICAIPHNRPPKVPPFLAFCESAIPLEDGMECEKEENDPAYDDDWENVYDVCFAEGRNGEVCVARRKESKDSGDVKVLYKKVTCNKYLGKHGVYAYSFSLDTCDEVKDILKGGDLDAARDAVGATREPCSFPSDNSPKTICEVFIRGEKPKRNQDKIEALSQADFIIKQMTCEEIEAENPQDDDDE